jgi:hypothetical protein
MPAMTRALLLALLTAGCAHTTLRSGLPPGDSPRAYTDKWHAAFLFGLVEASGPYDLDGICPSGWSEVTLEPDPFTALAGLVTLFIYSPSRVTIVCAAESGTAPTRAGYGLPRAKRSERAP